LRGVRNSLLNILSISEHLSCSWRRYSSGTWGITNSSLLNVLWDTRHTDISWLPFFKKAWDCQVQTFQYCNIAWHILRGAEPIVSEMFW
jgi:hypothetical protein